jgi:hypothetical protein
VEKYGTYTAQTTKHSIPRTEKKNPCRLGTREGFSHVCLLKTAINGEISVNNSTADNSQDLAEECRKALEQSYGCPIPLPKLFRKKPNKIS